MITFAFQTVYQNHNSERDVQKRMKAATVLQLNQKTHKNPSQNVVGETE